MINPAEGHGNNPAEHGEGEEMAKYRKKPVIVESDGPLIESRIVVTAHGRVRAEAGDYILTDPLTMDTWPIKPDIFAALTTTNQPEGPGKYRMTMDVEITPRRPHEVNVGGKRDHYEYIESMVEYTNATFRKVEP